MVRSGVTIGEAEFPLFVQALRAACEPLAIGIVRGGEGATKLITVRVIGAQSNEDARRTARAIANSPLVKTAVHGGDPNWGRLIAVAGRSGSAFKLDGAAVRIGPVELFRDGAPFDERAPEAASVPPGQETSRSKSISARAAADDRTCGPAISAPSTSGSTQSTGPEEVRVLTWDASEA